MNDFPDKLKELIRQAVESGVPTEEIAIYLSGNVVTMVNYNTIIEGHGIDTGYIQELASQACRTVEIQSEKPSVNELNGYLIDALMRYQHNLPQLNEARGAVSMLHALQCVYFAIYDNPKITDRFFTHMFEALKKGVIDYENLRGNRGEEYLRRCGQLISGHVSKESPKPPRVDHRTFPDPSTN